MDYVFGRLGLEFPIVSVPHTTTLFSSHTIPATGSTSSQPNSIFLSHHSSSSLQLQPAERSESAVADLIMIDPAETVEAESVQAIDELKRRGPARRRGSQQVHA